MGESGTDESRQRMELAEGAHVFAADGAELGTLGSIRDGCFKVEASLATDYWLPFDAVARNEGNDVYLGLSEAEVAERKLDAAAETRLADTEEAAIDPARDSPEERRRQAEGDLGLHPRPRL